MKITAKVFLIIVLFTWTKGYSQHQDNEFIILTFELKTQSHGLIKYYWISSVDSLNTRKGLSPVYLHTFFSTNDFTACCNNKPIDIFTSTTESNYKFEDEFNKNLDALNKIVLSGRRKIQTIKKTWDKGLSETITVYATSIKGQFCKCGLIGRSLKLFESYEGDIYYKGGIYLPTGHYD